MNFFDRATGVIQPQKYQDALQHPERAFHDPVLRRSRVEMKNGLPKPRSGGYALVYRLTSRDNPEHRETVTALRCFREPKPDLAARYRTISDHLDRVAAKSDFFVTTRYLEQGIRIDGAWKPVTTMRWIEGEYLDVFLDHASVVPFEMAWLERQIRDVADELHRTGMAHGDLHQKNILISRTPSGPRFHLIDYDGMYVPALAKHGSRERGHEDYQHPGRDEAFGPHLDDFSLMVLYLNIVAVQRHPALWEARSRVEGLLTREVDYLNPDDSETLQLLARHPDLRRAVTAFKRMCLAPFSEILEPREFFALFSEAAPPVAPSHERPVDQAPMREDRATDVLPPTTPVGPGPRLEPIQRPERSKAIFPELPWLIRREGEEAAIIGRFSGSVDGDGTPSSPYRTYHLEAGGGATFEIWVEPDVDEQFRAYDRGWTPPERGDWIWVKGLLLRDGNRFVIDLEQAANIAKVTRVDSSHFTFDPELAAQMAKEARAAVLRSQRWTTGRTQVVRQPVQHPDRVSAGPEPQHSPSPTSRQRQVRRQASPTVQRAGEMQATDSRIRELLGMPKERR